MKKEMVICDNCCKEMISGYQNLRDCGGWNEHTITIKTESHRCAGSGYVTDMRSKVLDLCEKCFREIIPINLQEKI